MGCIPSKPRSAYQNSHRTRSGALPTQLPNGSRLRNIPRKSCFQYIPLKALSIVPKKPQARRRSQFFRRDTKISNIHAYVKLNEETRRGGCKPLPSRRAVTLRRDARKETPVSTIGTPAKAPVHASGTVTQPTRHQQSAASSLAKAREIFLPKRLNDDYEIPPSIKERLVEDVSNVCGLKPSEVTDNHLCDYSTKLYNQKYRKF